MAKRRKSTEVVPRSEPDYGGLLTGISDLLDQARRMSARTVNNIITATYWEIGRRIVEYEQGGKARAEYGEAVLKRLGARPDGETRPRVFGSQISDKCGRFTWVGRFADTVGKIRGFGEITPKIWGKATTFCRHRRQNSKHLASNLPGRKASR